jgi:hypothetical protein
MSAVDAYFKMELLYFWVRLPNNLSRWQIIFEKFQNSEWTHPLTKLNKNKSCYVDSIWLW